MKFRLPIFLASLLSGSLPLAASAHHSMAIYDTSQVVTINGTVTEVRWRNPHVYIYVEAALDAGQLANWEIEGLHPGGFRRVGWERDTLVVGDSVTVVGNPTRSESRRGIYPQSITSEGVELFSVNEFFQLALTAGDAGGARTNSIAGTWATVLNYDVLRLLGEDAEVDNLTDAAERAVANFDEQAMNPAANCGQMVAPWSMFMPDVKRIVMTDDSVTITGDYDSASRTILIDPDPVADIPVSEQGYAVGHWEGTTLVVRTTHFAENRMGNGFGVPSSPQKEVQERFTLSDDRQRITYEQTLTDPVYLSAPITGSTEWKAGSNLEFGLDDCDLESARTYLQE